MPVMRNNFTTKLLSICGRVIAANYELQLADVERLEGKYEMLGRECCFTTHGKQIIYAAHSVLRTRNQLSIKVPDIKLRHGQSHKLNHLYPGREHSQANEQ